MTPSSCQAGSLRPRVRARRLRRRLRRRHARSQDPRDGPAGPHVAVQPRPPWRDQRRGQRRRRRRHPHPDPRPASSARSATSTSRPPAPTPSASAFLPADPAEADAAAAAIEKLADAEGLTVLGWRDVPVDNSTIGSMARDAEPTFRQLFVAAADGDARRASSSTGKAFILRKRIEHETEPGWRRHLLPVAVGSDHRLQGHAHARCSCRSSSPTSTTSATRPPSPWSTPGSRPTRSRRGRWPTRTGWSPTTARSTPCRATRTGCGPARARSSRRCSATRSSGPSRS